MMIMCPRSKCTMQHHARILLSADCLHATTDMLVTLVDSDTSRTLAKSMCATITSALQNAQPGQTTIIHRLLPGLWLNP
jgi:hypothetical protein